jgi:hypothetical protein
LPLKCAVVSPLCLRFWFGSGTPFFGFGFGLAGFALPIGISGPRPSSRFLAPSGKNLRSVLFLRSRYECSPMLPPFGPVTSRFQVAAIISSVSSSPGFLSWPGRRSSSSRSALASSAPDSSASVPSAGLLFLARCFQYCTGRISLVSGSCVEPTPRLSSIRFILGAGPFDFCYRGLGLPPSGTGHRFPPA